MNNDNQGWDKIAKQERKNKRVDRAFQIGGGAFLSIGVVITIILIVGFLCVLLLLHIFG